MGTEYVGRPPNILVDGEQCLESGGEQRAQRASGNLSQTEESL